MKNRRMCTIREAPGSCGPTAGCCGLAGPYKTTDFSRSGSGVKTIVNGAKPRLQHVCIDLRRRKIGMTEHHLDRPQIGAALEQVGGERVTDHMRAQFLSDASALAV